MYLPICGDVSTPNKCKGKEEKGSEVYNIWIGSWPKRITSDVGWNFLCVFIQFVNGHFIDDSEPP
jgi:hypothetical protein